MFEGLERVILSKDWITIVFLLTLTIITVLKYQFSDRFTKLFSLSYSDKYYTDYVKTNPLILNKFHLLFFIVIFFNISMLIFFSLQVLEPSFFSNSFYSFAQILSIVILYIVLRQFIGFILGEIFELHDQQKQLTFLKISNLPSINKVTIVYTSLYEKYKDLKMINTEKILYIILQREICSYWKI